MGLKATVLSAVEQAKIAIGDLAVPMILRTRQQSAYQPGESVSYSNVDSSAMGVISRYREDEIDGTLIQRIDLLIILFPPANKAIPKPNDVLISGDNEWRVIANNPIYAGSEIALNQVQVRPPI